MKSSDIQEIIGLYFKPHPWHGITPGPEAPQKVQAYIEIVPTDAVKFEIDKPSGILRLDRPQRFSSFSPSLYGFVPRTYCGPKVAAYSGDRTARDGIVGDGDPLDICVLTEKTIMRGDFLVNALPIGGLRLLDQDQADDKIIAVLEGDVIFGGISDISGLQEQWVERLVHYFLSYKDLPGEAARTRPRKVECEAVFGRREALKVIELSMEDYRDRFGDPDRRLENLFKELSR
ncbi:inorganic pyrophosphatase [bacterium CPR1]|nr:inorganic pyrophosphatase [bacterium CPR1]